MPCKGCPNRDACYGPDSLVSGRIVLYRFFLFYMMMFPAPSCLAAAFIPLISGDTAAALPGANNGVSAPGANRFLFQDQDRQFLEILYFLGAVWFRTLLVNSRQQVDTVYAEVGRLLRHMDIEKGFHALEIEPSEPLDVFAGSQIFWVPDQRILADNWKGYWKQAMHMGFELVDAGLKNGIAWDHGQFRLALDALRNQIRDDMFSGPAIASVGKEKTTASEKISTVLQGILQKWQADSARAGGQSSLEVEPEYPDIDETIIMSSATEQPTSLSERGVTSTADMHAKDKPGMPPDGTDGDADIQETVIFSSAGEVPQSESTLRGFAESQPQESKWRDNEKTVVLRADPAISSTKAVSPEDDMERTVIISAPSMPPDASLPRNDDDLAATMFQNAPGPPPSPSGGFDGGLEATVVLNVGGPPDAKKEAPLGDDKDGIMEQTIIIRSDVKKE